jgi:hypothetical protein
MRALIRFTSVGLLALVACSKANPAPPPTFWYNDLMRQAGIQGAVRFRVRLDSAGSPQLTTFQIVTTPNPVFTLAVRNGLREWRDPSRAGRMLEQTVLFILMDTAAADSIARCRTSGGEWAVCGRRGRTTTLFTLSAARAPNKRLKLAARVDY